MAVSCQALDQRFTSAAVVFLRALLGHALCQQADLGVHAASRLSQFTGVYLVDGTVLDCGDKLLTQLNLTTGQMTLEVVPATVHDNRIALAHAPLPPGALRLTDLGFFDLAAFARIAQDHGFWLTRYKARTCLLAPGTGQPLSLPDRLPASGDFCCPVLVGKTQRLPAWLVARRVAPDQAANRRQRRAYRARRKCRPVSAATLTLADWDLYLTNIPDPDVDTVCALAHARWQIEIVFKVWKSAFGLAQFPTADPIRQRCLLYAPRLALWLAHCLLTLDAAPNRSWWQAFQVLRHHATAALLALRSRRGWRAFLAHLARVLPLTSRLSKRKAHPLTFQSLLDPP